MNFATDDKLYEKPKDRFVSVAGFQSIFKWLIPVTNSQMTEMILLVGQPGDLGTVLLFSLVAVTHSLNFSSALLRRSFSCSSFRAASSCKKTKTSNHLSHHQTLFINSKMTAKAQHYFLLLFLFYFFSVLLLQPVSVLLLSSLFNLPLFFQQPLRLLLLLPLFHKLLVFLLEL